ncbi:MAG: APC family permease [Deltaproteobacteria bacterium]|nr:APC family permease [Deltaproteobacteria bacterium]
MAEAKPADADPSAHGEPFDFAGWGTAGKITDLAPEKRQEPPPKHKLGTLAATAISGNDITSSCLYVSALCAAQAGKYAPIALGIVALVLYFFRKIYAEVGSALPLNGGTYTVLLNTTSKRTAAGAAVLTLLSYVATAVISAGEAMHYAHHLVPGLPVFWATIGLLAFFAFLNVMGISESAIVAIIIFAFHMITLTVLSAASIVTVSAHPEILSANWATPTPGGITHALFFGFAAAMLGISGFESSANFIEEQEDGVFPKTLRNMWLAVAIFNPLTSLLSLGLIPLAQIQKVPPDLLAQMGIISWGHFLGVWVSIDAVLVLSGAVLTSYVGVTGLMRRMALDRCLPQLLLKQNGWRHTNHYIIGLFFAIAVAILFVTGGNVSTLAGVYTISFLSVMALFAIGNMLLKIKRGRLPRSVKASWVAVVFGLSAVLLALIGNILMNPVYISIFAMFFAAMGTAVAIMFLRIQLLRVGLFMVNGLVQHILHMGRAISDSTERVIHRIKKRPAIYFTRGDSPASLNRAALYVIQNEQTERLIIVHLYEDENTIPDKLSRDLYEIDRLYPELRVDFLAVKGIFTPEAIDALSKRLGVPHNYMFIGTPSDQFAHRIETLGGVRVIL